MNYTAYVSVVDLVIRVPKVGNSKGEPSEFSNVFLNERHKANPIPLSV